MDNQQDRPNFFDIHVAEGSHYEVGKQRAITMKEHYSEDIPYFTSPIKGQNYITASTSHKRMILN
ncbi:hypothetical protein J14TS5_57200 [Paenibacillus lautus]|nr:hypothetical protein J14TS5_57200 [Paenibacillus lautus]